MTDMRECFITLVAWLCMTTIGHSSVGMSNDSLETNTVLYQVAHPDSRHVSYLFGTHHAFGKPFFDSLEAAREALQSCSLLVKENLNIPGQLAVDIIQRRTEVTKWKHYLKKEDDAFVRELLSPTKLDLDKMTPAELTAHLNRYYKERICIGKDPAAPYFSLDDYIASLAEENHIPVIGLETTEDQLYLINEDVRGMPRKVHRKRLESLIHRIRSGSADHCSEIEWYRAMHFDLRLDEPCRNTLVLADRNDQWMSQLEDHLMTESCFVAVGLSHLMFDCGLISQLSELGYQIIPIDVQ